ncbi:hypothetical protein VTI74DRAFT_9115 [Chaetomium olivicolor]
MSRPAVVLGTERPSTLDLGNQGQAQGILSSLVQHPLVRRFFSLLRVKDGEVYEAKPETNPKWYQRLLDAGVEENGTKPVPLEQRTSTQYNNLFTVFFTCLLCLLPIPTGMLGYPGHGHETTRCGAYHSFLCPPHMHPACFHGHRRHGDGLARARPGSIFVRSLPRYDSPRPERRHADGLLTPFLRRRRPDPRIA